MLVLREIRDGIKTTNARVDGLSDQARATRATNKHLVATEMVAVAGAVRDVAMLVREMRDRKIKELETRLAAVERKVG